MWLYGRCWRIKPPGALTGYPSKPRGHLDRIARMGRPAGAIQDLNVQGQHAASPRPKRCAEPRRSQCLFQATIPHVPRTCGRRRVPNPTTVIPAKAGIHIPRTLKLLLLRQGLWIPASAGMTKKNAPPSCRTLRQAQDRLVPASTGRLWPSRGVDPDQRRDDEGNMPSTPPTQPLYISAKP